MQTLVVSLLAVLLTTNLLAEDSAPTNLVGHVIWFDQTLAGGGIGTVTMDAEYTYFSFGDPREPYVYEKLSTNSFRVTNFDPDNPTVAWSHLLFTFTNADSGTIYDEDAEESAGLFQLFPPSPPILDVPRLHPTNIVVAVSCQVGQIIVLEESTNLLSWSPVATNVVWAGRWDAIRPVSVFTNVFFRAYIPTQ
jgi:hypothetical protein